MQYLAYLFPLLLIGGIYLYDPARIMSFDPVELAILAGVSLAIIGGVHALVRYLGKDIEFLSGYVVKAKHFRPWTERVVYTETVSDGKGKTRQVQRVRYVHHPDEWKWELNTGRTTDISESKFRELAYRWTGGSTYYFPTYHVNCVSGGGGDAVDWDQVEDHVETETYESRYTNPLDHSNSIFRYKEISKAQAREMGLYDYPKIQVFEQKPIIGLDVATDADQRAFQLLNALFGSYSQIHFFVLLYEASKGLTIGEDQRAYWHGGNKNEFTICLGVEKSEDGQAILKWCNAFSWMDEPVLELAVEDWARDRIDQPLQLQEFAAWLRKHLGLWKRKEWKDFAYLSNPMRPWQLICIFATALAATAGVFYYIFYAY